MEMIHKMIDIIIHVDKYLDLIITYFGLWTYLILFVIIFLETGFVVTPFLPGDSLLFAIGAFAARGTLNFTTTLIVLCIAAIAGDTVNYWIGKWMGPKVFTEKIRFLKKEYLDRTHAFYEKYGGKTIIMARFIPIIRTFAPFVAGIGKMTYSHFISFNVIGGISWVSIFLFGGYKFGDFPIVKKNFTLVIMAIIVISVLPAIIEFIRQRREYNKLCAVKE